MRRALLVGCNYPGTDYELKGCVNDVMTMKHILLNSKGFAESEIRVMIDTDSKFETPSGLNIRKALTDLCTKAQAGDILFFHYSGHGTQVPVLFDPEESDGKREAICPTDMNLVVDHDLREIVNLAPQNVQFTLIFDCCHSGGILDSEVVQIAGEKKTALRDASAKLDFRSRELPIDTVADILSKMLKKKVPAQAIQGAVGELFGQNASKFLFNPAVEKVVNNLGAKFGLSNASGMLQMAVGSSSSSQSQSAQSGTGNPMAAIVVAITTAFGGLLQQLSGRRTDERNNQIVSSGAGSTAPAHPLEPLINMLGGSSGIGGMIAQLLGIRSSGTNESGMDFGALVEALGQNPDHHQAAAQEFQEHPDRPPKPAVAVKEVPILITGCQSNETSADVRQGGTAFGALSNAVKTAVQDDPSQTYYDLVTKVRKSLARMNMAQNPCLSQKQFIC